MTTIFQIIRWQDHPGAYACQITLPEAAGCAVDIVSDVNHASGGAENAGLYPVSNDPPVLVAKLRYSGRRNRVLRSKTTTRKIARAAGENHDRRDFCDLYCGQREAGTKSRETNG